MIALDKSTLPRRIAKDDVRRFVGEDLFWFCSTCGKWRTSTVSQNGDVSCPVCDGSPDWDKHPPTLAYQSRYGRVLDLCADGSEWRKSYNNVEQQFGQYIDDVYSGLLSRRARESGWKYFQAVWREVDKLSDYLLMANDVPAMDIPYVYTEKGLQRKYYDSDRGVNVVSLSDAGLKPEFDDSGVQCTGQEAAELMAYDPDNCEQYTDKYFRYAFLDNIRSPLEREIAYWLSTGEGKRDIERMFGLTEQQVRTIVKHLKKSLNREFFENCA